MKKQTFFKLVSTKRVFAGKCLYLWKIGSVLRLTSNIFADVTSKMSNQYFIKDSVLDKQIYNGFINDVGSPTLHLDHHLIIILISKRLRVFLIECC